MNAQRQTLPPDELCASSPRDTVDLALMNLLRRLKTTGFRRRTRGNDEVGGVVMSCEDPVTGQKMVK